MGYIWVIYGLYMGHLTKYPIVAALQHYCKKYILLCSKDECYVR
ncbi:hypothetical protein C7475_102645 [Chitinophaga sp. S165]|nr:hypothetical protein C7475_102645 [Chitinophaga sp. S165]